MSGNKPFTIINVGPQSANRLTSRPITRLTSITAPVHQILGTLPASRQLGDSTLTQKKREEFLRNARLREDQLDLLIITHSDISLYSYDEMQKIATVRVTNRELEGPNSVNDEAMGVVGNNKSCAHCGQIDCPGHYGFIDFNNFPIYNPTLIREIVSVLTCVCNNCGKLLVTQEYMEIHGLMKLTYDKRLSALEKICASMTTCTRVQEILAGSKTNPCVGNPEFVTKEIKKDGVIRYKMKKSKNTDSETIYIKPINDVITILANISTEDTVVEIVEQGVVKRKVMYSDARLLGFAAGSYPRNMILEGVLVPPVIARPHVYQDGAMHFDVLTHMYVAIVKKVQDLQSGKISNSQELYELIRQLIFATDSKKMGTRDFVPIWERIQGKSAIMRNLLMGKRDNYCGRTVAGPDSTLQFGQIGIPVFWCNVLTKRVRVAAFNYDYLSKIKDVGQITHVTSIRNGLRQFYDINKPFPLQIGDIVDRWLENGDRVIVNRQPTLHRQSMMAYDVVLRPQLTVGLHLYYTPPMNCDFDGDENNVWNPQDFEVEAEVEIILDVKANLMSSEQNRPIMGGVMNTITAAYLLPDVKTVLTDNLFRELLSLVVDKRPLATLAARLYKYGVNPRSGNAIFSAMLPEDFNYRSGKVYISEGILISGRLTKGQIGASGRSIVQDLWKKYGNIAVVNFFTSANWILNKWIIERGFTVGLSDIISIGVGPNGEYDKNEASSREELTKMYVQLEALSVKFEDKYEEINRRRQIAKILDNGKVIGLNLAQKVLAGDNSIGIMTDYGAGTKGQVANIAQIMGAVGQQNYRGQRLQPTISNRRRLLPTFDLDDQNPEANGFIPNSFYTGLTPEDLFFLHAGARENIMDTALKTAETGSMQHRMIKAFENVIAGYDGSIRNTIGTMFSPLYNSGYDIGSMIKITSPRGELTSFVDIKSVVTDINTKRGWIAKDINNLIVVNRKIPDLENEKILPLNPPTVITTIPLPTVNTNVNRLSKYEKARLIGARATQLSNDADPLLTVEEMQREVDPIKIATMEYQSGLLANSGLYIIRRNPNGTFDKKVYPTLDNI